MLGKIKHSNKTITHTLSGEKIMRYSSCGMGTEVKLGLIETNKKGYICEPNGERLYVYADSIVEALTIPGINSAVGTKESFKFNCETDTKFYKGAKYTGADDWSDGLQIFAYDPKRIAF